MHNKPIQGLAEAAQKDRRTWSKMISDYRGQDHLLALNARSRRRGTVPRQGVCRSCVRGQELAHSKPPRRPKTWCEDR